MQCYNSKTKQLCLDKEVALFYFSLVYMFIKLNISFPMVVLKYGYSIRLQMLCSGNNISTCHLPDVIGVYGIECSVCLLSIQSYRTPTQVKED